MRLLLASLAVLAACGSSHHAPPAGQDAAPAATPPPPAAAAAAAAAAVPAPDLGWLPADTAMVIRFPPATAPLLAAIARLPQAPACVAELRGQLDAVYSISRSADDQAVLVATGHVDRAALEACVTAALGPVFASTGATLAHEADGAFTKFTVGGVSQWVGYAPDGRIALHADRARVEDALAATDRLAPGSPMRALLPRLSTTAGSVVSILDFTTKAFGAPSTGAVMTLARAPDGSAPVHLLAASPADAAALAAAITATAARPGLPPELARLVASLAPRVDGNEVVLDVGPVLADPKAIGALSSFLGVGAVR